MDYRKGNQVVNTSRVWILLVGTLLVGALLAGCNGPVSAMPAVQEATATPTAVPATPVPPSPASQEAATALEDQVVYIYESTRGSVVNITNRGYAVNYGMQVTPVEGTGSGFIYDAEGHIVTNFHVVENAEELMVTLADGTNVPAEIVGSDPSTDLAVIRIEVDNLPPLIPLEEPGGWRVGEFVVAIGNPFGLEGTMTMGVISSLGRVIQSPDGRFVGEAIQTDAAINPGNSGGPLLNLEGRVIGVNSQIISTSGASSGIGFAVPVDTVQAVVTQLIDQGYYAHPWLGIQTIDLSSALIDILTEASMQVPVEEGVFVVDVVDSSPAARAGIQGGDRTIDIGRFQIPVGGDIITAINGTPTPNLQELSVYLERNTEVGETVTLSIIRDGQAMDVDVELGERPQELNQ
jgi:S1-C subfamily serine protease